MSSNSMFYKFSEVPTNAHCMASFQHMEDHQQMDYFNYCFLTVKICESFLKSLQYPNLYIQNMYI